MGGISGPLPQGAVDLALRLLGWRMLLVTGDAAVVDRWKWLAKRLAPGAQQRTLDAGSGNGAFTMYAAAIGNEAIGVTFDPDQVTKARHRSALLGLQCFFDEVDLRRLDEHAAQLGAFDQIVCCEVIEHIGEDEAAVRSLGSLLRPGGRLLLTTPFDQHPPLVGESELELEEGGHVRWGYSVDELRRLHERAGLEVLEVTLVSGFVTQKLVNLGRRLGRGFDWLVTLAFLLVRPLDRHLTRLLRYPHHCVAIVSRQPSPDRSLPPRRAPPQESARPV